MVNEAQSTRHNNCPCVASQDRTARSAQPHQKSRRHHAELVFWPTRVAGWPRASISYSPSFPAAFARCRILSAARARPIVLAGATLDRKPGLTWLSGTNAANTRPADGGRISWDAWRQEGVRHLHATRQKLTCLQQLQHPVRTPRSAVKSTVFDGRGNFRGCSALVQTLVTSKTIREEREWLNLAAHQRCGPPRCVCCST